MPKSKTGTSSTEIKSPRVGVPIGDDSFKKNKAMLRPLVEEWYRRMKVEDPNFKKLRRNEINKVVRAAARNLDKY